MKHTSFETKRWFSSAEPFQPLLSPLHHGWKLENGKYILNWFNGESALKSLDIILKEHGDLEDVEHEDDFDQDFDSDFDEDEQEDDHDV